MLLIMMNGILCMRNILLSLFHLLHQISLRKQAWLLYHRRQIIIQTSSSITPIHNPYIHTSIILFVRPLLDQQQFIRQIKYMRHQQTDSDEDNQVELPIIHSKGSPAKRRSRPILVNLADCQYAVVEEVCWEMGFEIGGADCKWDLRWTDGAVSVEMLSKMQSHQKVNHFPGMSALSRKNNLAKNIGRLQMAYPQHYGFIPKTFLLPSDTHLLRTYVHSSRREYPRTFIVKPQASCQGRGIFLSQDLTEIESNGQCVVQVYLENPLLYKGLKFDMRVYALVAGCDPLRIYIYNQGLVRFATQKYERVNEDNIDNMYMHLTNYAINKDSPKYVFNQSLDNLSLGHKKSLAEFFQTLKGLGLPAHEYWSGIKDCIVKSVISAQPHLQHQYRMAQPHNLRNDMCYQVLGFDFMLDDTGRVYLLQVNYTPSFSTETPLDHLIKSNLIADTLKLMNVTTNARNNAQKIAREELQRRVFTGKTLKYTPQQRQRVIRCLQQQRDDYEKKHLGSFEKIYPTRNLQRQKKYLQLLEYSLQEYKQANSPQKNAHTRRSISKYRIKRIISHHTIVDQQHEGRPKRLHHQKPLLQAKKQDRQFYSKRRNYGQQLRQMDLASLKTKQQQKTMFSRQFQVDPIK